MLVLTPERKLGVQKKGGRRVGLVRKGEKQVKRECVFSKLGESVHQRESGRKFAAEEGLVLALKVVVAGK